jgi:hypothetical protein
MHLQQSLQQKQQKLDLKLEQQQLMQLQQQQEQHLPQRKLQKLAKKLLVVLKLECKVDKTMLL